MIMHTERKTKDKLLFLLVKRVTDIVISSICLFMLFPILLIIALLIKLDSKGSALFIQERSGKEGKIFKIYKFRSMVTNAHRMGLGLEVAKDDFRITRVGSLIRRLSLDELPQLINVLNGDMSIVGPRPALPHQLEKYTDRQRKRLLVKPGITGWAQINGRNNLDWPERIELDVWYVDNQTFLLDLIILIKTIKVVLSREGSYGKDGVTRDLRD